MENGVPPNHDWLVKTLEQIEQETDVTILHLWKIFVDDSVITHGQLGVFLMEAIEKRKRNLSEHE